MFDSFNKACEANLRVLLNTFWFVPGVVSLLGPLLAFLLLEFDQSLQSTQEPFFVFRGGVGEASVILSTIAGSLVTVAGLAFSITIVVLQLVSSQYTPRALRGFLQDRVTQVVAGGFFAIFAYSLIVLAVMRDPSQTDHGFVPAVSVTIAIGLGFLGLVFLLIFVHHTGRVIQVSDIAARLAQQTLESVDHSYPQWEIEEDGEGSVSRQIQTWHAGEEPARIRATGLGYVQRIELTHLTRDLVHPGLHFLLLVSPGDFVTEETTIVEVRPAHIGTDERVKFLHDHIIIERERDISQDARFGVRQIADIALRALSPAVNDPTTGVLCIKYLQAIFERLVHYPPPPNSYRFAGGTSSLEIHLPPLEEYLEVFAEIALYAGGNMRVIHALQSALTGMKEVATLRERQDLLPPITAALDRLSAAEDTLQSNSTIPSHF